jgi:hypothetical protein
MQAEGAKLPGGFADFLVDGLHLTSAGNVFLFTELVALIEEQYNLKATDMPLIWPDRNSVDWENPANTFVHRMPYPQPVCSPTSPSKPMICCSRDPPMLSQESGISTYHQPSAFVER